MVNHRIKFLVICNLSISQYKGGVNKVGRIFKKTPFFSKMWWHIPYSDHRNERCDMIFSVVGEDK